MNLTLLCVSGPCSDDVAASSVAGEQTLKGSVESFFGGLDRLFLAIVFGSVQVSL